jgi:hypothetical protein
MVLPQDAFMDKAATAPAHTDNGTLARVAISEKLRAPRSIAYNCLIAQTTK